MSYVEIETGRFVKRWAFWNPATWSIPKLYWDAWSQEQRLHAICRQLEKVIKYSDYIGVNVDDIAARLKAIEEGQLDDFIIAAIEEWFEEHEPEIWQSLTELQNTTNDIIAEIGDGFSSENTISNAIAAINGNIEDIETSLNGEIEKTELYQKANYPSNTIVPQYMGDIIIEQQHGSCCEAQNHIYMFCTDNYDEGNGRIYIADMINNDYQVKSGVSIGHANSCAHDTVRNCFWIAPYHTYGTGTRVDAHYAIKYDYEFTSRNILEFDENVFCVSFDSITETMYFATEGISGLNIFGMNSDEIEPSFIANMNYDLFDNWPTVSLQDMAVHDNTFFVCRPEGTMHVFQLENGSFEQVNTYKIDYRDAGDIIRYGEVEGIEFNENGLLYNARNFYYGFTKENEEQRYGLNDASVTVLSTDENIYPVHYHQQRQITGATLVPNTKFTLGRGEIRTLRQLNHFNMMNHNVSVSADTEIDEMGRVTITAQNLQLRIYGTYTCNGFIATNCQFSIQIESSGILNIDKPIGSAIAIDFTNRFNVFTIWNEGTINLAAEISYFIWNAYGCSLIYIGKLNNLASVVIGSTTVSQYKFVIRNTIMNP